MGAALNLIGRVGVASISLFMHMMWKINIYSLKTHLTRSGQSDQIPKQDQNRPTEKLKQKFRQATFLIGESSVEGKCLAWLSFQAGVCVS